MIECVDPDDAGGVSYNFVTLLNEMFSIDVNTGVVQRAQNISFTNTFIYEIQCMDIEHLNDTALISITIYAPNLNPPIFSMPAYEFSIAENENQFSPVGMVSGVDQDGDGIEYALRGRDAVFFIISDNDGTILSTIVFDREIRDNYSMIVVAYDVVTTSERRSTNATVNVRIEDVNDNQPMFIVDNSGSLPAVVVHQNLPQNAQVAVVLCTDEDIDVNSQVSYVLMTDSNAQFSINPVTGNITFVGGELSLGPVFSLLVQCTDGIGNDTLPVTITVVEENRHDPVLDHGSLLLVSVDETLPLDSVMIDINATDIDEGQAGRIVYYLIDGFDVFTVNSETGIIRVSDLLDYETVDMYTITVIAENPETPGINARSVSVTVQVTVNNINDHVPEFLQENYTVSVQETYVNDENNMFIIPPPKNFMNISCTDRDIGTQTITYSLNSNAFVIDPILGNISAIQNLDFETISSYSLEAYCYDNGLPNGNNLTGTTVILITILPVNEHRPVIEHRITFVSIDETTEISTVIVSFDPDTPGLLNYMATDADSGEDGTIFYFLGEDTELGLFSVDRDRGVYQLANTLDADNAETAISFTRIHVVACDSLAIQRDCIIVVVRIIISAVNEHLPMFIENPYHFVILESTPPSTTSPVFNISCNDDDEMVRHGRTTVTVIFSENNVFRIDRQGTIFLQEGLDYENRVNYTYELMCSDGEFFSATIVRISVLPENDNVPRLVGSQFNFNVSVSTPVLSHIGRVTAIDDDIDEGALLTFILQTNEYFSITAHDGYIVLLTELDNPAAPTPPPEFSLRVDVTDGLTNLVTNITILLTDGNYVAPVFDQYFFISTVDEMTEIGHLIQILTCHDNETGVNGEATYQISSGNDEGLFEVASDNGDLTVAGNLVLPENNIVTDHVLTVECHDGGVPVLSATAQLIVRIEANVHLQVVANSTTVFVAENAEVNHMVTNIVPSNDSDNNQLMYVLVSGNGEMRFAITSDGSVVVHNLLDRETTDQYHLQVEISNSFSVAHVNVSIFIRDVNDNDPQCLFPSQILRVDEQLPVDSTILSLNCSDVDSSENGRLTYTLNESTFNVSTNGQLILADVLNASQRSAYSLNIMVHDNGNDPRSTLVALIVLIIPTNSNPPVIQNLPAIVSVNETTALLEVIYTVQASDPEAGQVTYRLEGDNDMFFIIHNTGDILLARKLDFYSVQSHTITIIASDTELDSEATNLTINVIDVNEFTPTCSQQLYYVNLAEDIEVNTTTDILSCTDEDRGENGNLIYSITPNDYFEITSQGSLFILFSLDYEMEQQYELTVAVSDNGRPPKSTSLLLTVFVSPVNEHSPQFNLTDYTVNILENVSLGDEVLQVYATDRDMSTHRDGQISYHIDSNGEEVPFAISSNGIIRLITTLDAESDQGTTFSFTVNAVDGGSPSRHDSARVQITVEDVNDNVPSFSQGFYTASISSSLMPGEVVLHSLNCTDPDSGSNGDVSYHLIGGTQFVVHETSGVIAVREQLPEIPQVLNFEVVCADMGTPSMSSSVQVSFVVTLSENVVFSESIYHVDVLEGSTFTEIVRVSASSSISNVIYDLLNYGDTFSIDSNTGAIRLVSSLDYEMNQSYLITVRAFGSVQFADALVEVNITNINDESPFFTERAFYVEVYEGATNLSNSTVMLNCTDNDLGAFGAVGYDVNDGNFVITNDGYLRLLNPLDFEANNVFILTANCIDGGTPPRTDSIEIIVAILPVNEYPPQFSLTSDSVSLSEDIRIGTPVYTASAIDQDSWPHQAVHYSIISGNEDNVFYIDGDTGVIIITNQLDYERVSEGIILTIQASDEDPNILPPFVPLSSTLTLAVTVTDVNDNRPRFTEVVYSYMLESPVVSNTPTVMASCIDTDSGSNGNISYSINSEGHFFQISDQGVITTAVDISTVSSIVYGFTIQCNDQGVPPLMDTSYVAISVTVERLGPVFSQAGYYYEVLETSRIGHEIGRVFAVNLDPDNQGSIEYFGNDTKFLVDRNTGTISLAATLDYELVIPQAVCTLIVYATDSAGLTNSVIVSIGVQNVNEDPPVIEASRYTVAILENIAAGYSASRVTCYDSDDLADNLLATLTVLTDLSELPVASQFSNQASLELITSRVLDYEEHAQFLIEIQCQDTGGLTATNQVRIVVEPFNEYPPLFEQAQYNIALLENPGIGSSVLTVTATDADFSSYNQIQYSLISGNTENVFFVDNRTGLISVSGLIDFEFQSVYDLVIQAADIVHSGDSSGSQPLSSTARLRVDIIDLNDNKPIVNPPFVTRTTGENLQVPSVIQKFQCSDADSSSNGDVTLQVMNDNFYLDGDDLVFNGSLFTGTRTTRVLCIDNGTPQLSSLALVTFVILPVSQHYPVLPESEFNITISDSIPVGTCFHYILATGTNGNNTTEGNVSYALTPTNNVIDIDAITGCIFSTTSINISATTVYAYIITAINDIAPSLNNTAVLYLTVTTTENSPPYFTKNQYEVDIAETFEFDEVFFTAISCIDPDASDSNNIEYALLPTRSHDLFFVHPDTGYLSIATGVTLDFEETAVHSFPISCIDNKGAMATAELTVNVNPVNEFTPLLQSVTAAIPETAHIGFLVATLTATDHDHGSDGEVRYDIVNTYRNDNNTFSLDPITGSVTLSSTLDYEDDTGCRCYNLTVTATDLSETVRRTATASLHITIEDINDNVPSFNNDSYESSLPATALVNTDVLSVNCSDSDAGQNHRITYHIIPNPPSTDIFSIDTNSGLIKVAAYLESRRIDNANFFVSCQDNVHPILTGTALVVIHIEDINLYRPAFNHSAYTPHILENHQLSQPIRPLSITAHDNDIGPYGRITFTIQTYSDPDGIFHINSTTGILTLQKSLDFERETSYHIIVVATDGAYDSVNRQSAQRAVEVTVISVNEYTPKCPRSVYTGLIADLFTGEILDFGCVDRDAGLDGVLMYTITDGNTAGYFAIQNSTLILSFAISPDVAQEIYNLNVTISDMGTPSRETVVSVQIYYSFDNLASPTFTGAPYNFIVSESANVGTAIGSVTATDTDLGIQGEVAYSLAGTSSIFRIDSIDGIIYLASTLDRERQVMFTLQVIASDQDPNSPMTISTTVTIEVSDVNDNYPVCSEDFYQFQIFSNLTDDSPVGTIVCFDADSGNNAILRYTIITQDSTFMITDSGEIMLQTGSDLDPSRSVLKQVLVSDDGNPSLFILVPVNIQVLFTNTIRPQFNNLPYIASIDEDTQLLDNIFNLQASDGDSNELTYSLIRDSSDTFYVNPNTGEIVLIRPLDYEGQQSYEIDVMVMDSGSYDGTNILTAMVTVLINIQNVNDVFPAFDSSEYSTIIPQSEPVGSRIITGTCTDNDVGTFGDVMVTWDRPGSPFQLEDVNGDFAVTVIDSSLASGSYSFTLTCSDGGGSNSVTALMYIIVQTPTDPRFSNTKYDWTLNKNANIFTTFSDIMATSPTSSDPIVYSLTTSSESFSINSETGVVSLTQVLDYESNSRFDLIVRATDAVNRFTDVLLLVQVADVNNQFPFILPSVNLSINKSHPINAPFGMITCPGRDHMTGNNFTFDPLSEVFFVDNVGVVYLIGELDMTTVYALNFVCSNVSVSEVKPLGILTISVISGNFYEPRFDFQTYNTVVPENLPPGHLVIQTSAYDGDHGIFGRLSHSIIDGNYNNQFFINSSTGEIKTIYLDYELVDAYNLTIAAVDGGLEASDNLRKTSTTQVHIFVIDYNDNLPTFEQTVYHITTTTVTPRNSLIGSVACFDHDSERNAEISYTLVPADNYYFSITVSGGVYLLENHPFPAVYTLTAVCADNGSPQLSSTAILSIIVNLEDPKAPVFRQDSLEITIDEDVTLFSLIASLSATPFDFSFEIQYNIVSGNIDGKFQVDNVTGELYNVQLLDAELISEYSIMVEARYTDYLTAVSFATIMIRVRNTINENAPYFLPDPLYTATVLEADGRQEIVRVHCVDNDTTTNIEYFIAGGNTGEMFSINNAGIIYSTELFDFELLSSSYIFTVVCTDGESIPKSATSQVFVSIGPENEHIPEFSTTGYSFTVAENAQLGTSVGEVSASDGDCGPHGHVTYHIITVPPFDMFFIHPTSGIIHLSGTLDYETINEYEMNIVATDGYSESAVPLLINVLDVNDNDPEVSPPVFIREIEHNTTANTVVAHFTCTDADTTVNFQNLLTMRITGGNELDWFYLTSNGDIVWSGAEIEINAPTYDVMEIHCHDSDRRSNPAYFTYIVYPAGQPLVQFRPSNIYMASVYENSPLATSVVTITTNSTTLYSIPNASSDLPFAVDQNTGEVQVQSTIDYESQQSYTFVVVATDMEASVSNAAVVHVIVNDINDNNPYFSMRTYSISLPESVVIPAYVTTVICMDRDNHADLQVSIVSHTSHFSISNDGSLSLVSSLDFETRRSHNMLLLCTDGVRSDSAELIVTVTSANEYPPIFINIPYTVAVVESTEIGRNITTVSAVDMDIDIGADIRFSLASPGDITFQIDVDSGLIHNQMPLQISSQSHYIFEVLATDGIIPSIFTSTALVLIEAVDINEPPNLIIHSSEVIASVASTHETVLLTFQCIDDDLGENAELHLSYEAMPNPGVDILTLLSDTGMITGQLYVNMSLVLGNYTMTITCTDSGSPPLSASENISLTVEVPNSDTPEILNDMYVVSVHENVANNSQLLTISASDPDGVVYQIVNGNEENNFYIDANNGSIFTRGSFDADFGTDSYVLTILVTDLAPTLPLSATTAVNILLLDVNDNHPTLIPSGSVVLNLLETTPVNTYIHQYSCSDVDSPSVSISIAPTGNISSTFRIVYAEDVWYVALQAPLDYDSNSVYSLTILCTDEETAILPRHTASTMLNINVSPVNIHAPEFSNATFRFSIADNSFPGAVVGFVSATDADNRLTTVKYSIINSPHSDLFTIDSLSGEIITRITLTSSMSVYNVTVQASDEDPLTFPRSSTASVTITVFKLNNRPTCMPQVIELSLNQTIFPDAIGLVNITCSDQDSGLNSLLMFSFQSVSHNAFSIRTISNSIGEVLVLGTLDPDIYILVVNVSDKGSPSLSELVYVIADTQEISSNSLHFSDPYFSVDVSENTPSSTIIFFGSDFSTRLMNMNGELSYSLVFDNLTESMFTIDASTGDVILQQQLDFESPTNTHVLRIEVEDGNSSHIFASLAITVTDYNDNAPLFSQVEYFSTIAEVDDVGIFVLQIVATDGDFGPVSYHLSTYTNYFTINSTTGILTTVLPIDKEHLPDTLSVVVNVTDSGSPQLFSVATVVLRILDINDNSPVFNQSQYLINITSVFPVGSVLSLSADDPDTNSELIFSINDDSGLFTIDPVTGILYLHATIMADHEEFYSFSVFVSDGFYTGSANVLVNILDVLLLQLNFTETDTQRRYVYNLIEFLISSGLEVLPNPAFTILSGNTNDSFQIVRGVLTNSHALDRETINSYDMIVTVNEGLPSQQVNTILLVITIIDINDNQPIFSQHIYEFSVTEGRYTSQLMLGYIRAIDYDAGVNSRINFNIIDDDVPFTVQFLSTASTNEVALSATGSIDRENIAQYNLTIVASDLGLPVPLSSDVRVVIDVIDINDNVPVFISSDLPLVAVGTPAGTAISTLIAADKDEGRNGDITFMMNATNNNNSDITADYSLEIISNGVARLITNKTIDLDSNGTLFTITAIDNGPVGFYPTGMTVPTISLSLVVVVNSSSDLHFTSLVYTGQLLHSSNVGEFVLQVVALGSSNGMVEYHILGDPNHHPFAVDLLEGTVTLQRQVVGPPSTRYEFYVEAVDGFSGRPGRHSAFVIIDLFENSKLLDIHTCKTIEELNDTITRELFRERLEVLIKQGSTTGSLFVNKVFSIEERNNM